VDERELEEEGEGGIPWKEGRRGDGRVERAEDTGEWEERGRGRGRMKGKGSQIASGHQMVCYLDHIIGLSPPPGSGRELLFIT